MDHTTATKLDGWVGTASIQIDSAVGTPDWTDATGPTVRNDKAAARLLVVSIEDGILVAYMDSQARPIAMEPRTEAEIRTIAAWLPAQMDALGALTVVIDGPLSITADLVREAGVLQTTATTSRGLTASRMSSDLAGRPSTGMYHGTLPVPCAPVGGARRTTVARRSVVRASLRRGFPMDEKKKGKTIGELAKEGFPGVYDPGLPYGEDAPPSPPAPAPLPVTIYRDVSYLPPTGFPKDWVGVYDPPAPYGKDKPEPTTDE